MARREAHPQQGEPRQRPILEELWNALATTRRFSLLCGYAMGNFYKEADWPQFNRVCGTHGHVMPTEQFSGLTDEQSWLRQIAQLQQRAQALETEIAHRHELETALRNALADRERVQAERERLLARERTARADAEVAGRLKDEFLAVPRAVQPRAGHGGAKAIAVSSVDQALLALSTRGFDVVIGDIGLPDRDGYALIEAIRHHRDPHVRAVRAIAVMSYAGERYRLRALSAGYDEYMSKPIEPDRFMQLVSDVMKRSRRGES